MIFCNGTPLDNNIRNLGGRSAKSESIRFCNKGFMAVYAAVFQ